MPLSVRTGLVASFAVTLLAASPALATNYTLWIHGKNSGGTQPGNYADFSNWGPSSTAAGVNKKAVNWDGRQRIGGQNYRIRDALDCFCTGTNWCYIAVNSAGDLQIGYALPLYGGTARYKKNAIPNSSGVCGNTDGATQVGWNRERPGHHHGARHVQPQHHAGHLVLHVRRLQGHVLLGPAAGPG